jgi:alpha-galactosidase
MRSFILTVISAFLVFSCNNYSSATKKESNELQVKAQTPPMGWNSWNSLDFRATEADIKTVADYMSENLLEYGWEYLVIDAGWYYPSEITCNDGKMDNIPQNLDDFGRLIPDVKKYPSSANNNGFRKLADYVHSKGLKFGIHIMRGVPRNAADSDLPVKDSDYKASEIADRKNTCNWNKSMYGIKNYEGAKAYYRSLIELYSDWGVDFIKADDMIRPLHENELKALSEAINEINPSIVLSLSPGKAKIADAQTLSESSEMWRVSNDFWDDWKYVPPMFELLKEWTSYRSYGNWPDADMLPFGKLRKNGGDEWVASLLEASPAGIIDEYSRLTPDEMYTVMTLWSIAKSPLMLGGYLPENDELTNNLISNKKAIRVNQHSRDNREEYYQNNIIVWKASDPEKDGTTYLAIFNLSDEKRDVTINFEELGYDGNLFRTYDIWQEKNLGILLYTIDFEINGHGVKFLELTAESNGKN